MKLKTIFSSFLIACAFAVSGLANASSQEVAASSVLEQNQTARNASRRYVNFRSMGNARQAG